MDYWKPRLRDQKQYPHFDAPLHLRDMETIANDPEAVAANSFMPFLKYEKLYQPFRTPMGGHRPQKKIREIRYASHRDSAIFGRYRSGLAHLYEKELDCLGISESVIAYRHIPVRSGSGVGKCNIHHAKEAFEHIKTIGHCCAVVMDISKYFEHLDHARLKALWCRLLGDSILPPDHYAVFKNITKYRIVNLEDAYKVLGYFGEKSSGHPGFLRPRKEIPKQLCSIADFHNKICGNGKGYKSLIHCHKDDYGIPQGAPLSDLLANLYLLDFDVDVHKMLAGLDGRYMRYSDDILLIIPGGPKIAISIMEVIQKKIETYGHKLKIKPSKCFVHEFLPGSGVLTHRHVYPKGRSSNGLSYLGFRFDGRHVHLRDSTVAGLLRRVSSSINREVYRLVKRYPGKSLAFLQDELDVDGIVARFGKVQNFEEKFASKRKWTFWTYAKRADRIFDGESRIMSRVTSLRKLIRSKALSRLAQAYGKSL